MTAGGGRGIRTPGELPHNGFQDRRIKPLCHPSESSIRACAVSADARGHRGISPHLLCHAEGPRHLASPVRHAEASLGLPCRGTEASSPTRFATPRPHSGLPCRGTEASRPTRFAMPRPHLVCHAEEPRHLAPPGSSCRGPTRLSCRGTEASRLTCFAMPRPHLVCHAEEPRHLASPALPCRAPSIRHLDPSAGNFFAPYLVTRRLLFGIRRGSVFGSGETMDRGEDLGVDETRSAPACRRRPSRWGAARTSRRRRRGTRARGR